MRRIATTMLCAWVVGCASPERPRAVGVDEHAIVDVAIGDRSTCVLRARGTVECDGHPVAIDDAVALSVGHDHTCVVRRGGTVACFGGNERGQLGDGTSVSREHPATVVGLGDVVGVSAALQRTCAWTSRGEAFCWGAREYDPHRMIDAPRVAVTPQRLPIERVRSVALGGFHGCALIEGGDVRCWGANYFGQLGDGTENAREEPGFARVRGATQIAAGTHHSCAVVADGALFCWGADLVGQLGYASPLPGHHHRWPIEIPGVGAVRALAAASDHTCVLLAGRTAPRCWGYNDVGQVCPGAPWIVRAATIPKGIDDAVSLAAGANRSCAVRADGEVRCWGYGPT